jgi:N-acetylglucosamine kinase-like BadF-type ATPase
MLLIAESGSSKTQWRIVSNETIISAETKGINPFFASEEFIHSELQNSELVRYQNDIGRILFYGSGCSHEERNTFLKNIFQKIFPNAIEIIVEHDLLAACIALFGKNDGIACIIGTGSNSCVYENGKITQNVPALGYILGDEASGAYLGKEILKHYIYKTLPHDIYEFISKEYKIDKEDIFNAVYKKELPNRFLASFAYVASQFRTHPFIQDILLRGFDEFVRYHIACYPEAKYLPISFVGSIASVFEEELTLAMNKFNLTIAKIDSHPVDALVRFYTSSKL